MKVAIEASAIVRRGKTGISYYLVNLFDALFALDDTHTYYLVYITMLGRSDEAPSYKYAHVKKRRIPYLPNRGYSKLHKMLLAPPFDLLASLKADVFIYPNYVSWRTFFKSKIILFVHDTAFLDTPQYLPYKSWLNLTKRVPKSIKRADRVMTISNHSKQRLIKHFGLTSSQVAVASPAVDGQFYTPRPTSEIEAAKRHYGIGKKYIYFIGTLEPRKNILGMVKAYQQLPANLRSQYQLVLGGDRGWIGEAEDQAIAQDSEGIIITGYIKHQDSPALLSGAEIFLFPSFYEGWGMPILEAMACGTPVITARNSSLPEAAGQAALFCDEHNPADIAAKITSLLESPQQRAQLIKKGELQAKKFSWETSAKELLAVIDSLKS
jgi:glycosyltransferase involved in cell wall biosynthesis